MPLAGGRPRITAIVHDQVVVKRFDPRTVLVPALSGVEGLITLGLQDCGDDRRGGCGEMGLIPFPAPDRDPQPGAAGEHHRAAGQADLADHRSLRVAVREDHPAPSHSSRCGVFRTGLPNAPSPSGRWSSVWMCRMLGFARCGPPRHWPKQTAQTTRSGTAARARSWPWYRPPEGSCSSYRNRGRASSGWWMAAESAGRLLARIAHVGRNEVAETIAGTAQRGCWHASAVSPAGRLSGDRSSGSCSRCLFRPTRPCAIRAQPPVGSATAKGRNRGQAPGGCDWRRPRRAHLSLIARPDRQRSGGCSLAANAGRVRPARLGKARVRPTLRRTAGPSRAAGPHVDSGRVGRHVVGAVQADVGHAQFEFVRTRPNSRRSRPRLVGSRRW